jgi:hypothetical protein
MKKHLIFLFLLYLFSNHLFAQTKLNFKPYAKNIDVAKATEYDVAEYLDSSVNRFLQVANNDTSTVHKFIQAAFELSKSDGHQHLFLYPKKIKKSNLTTQFLQHVNTYGLHGTDSTWNSEDITAIIFMPVMEETGEGQTEYNLSFKTSLVIYDVKGYHDSTSKPETSFKIENLDLDLLQSKVLYNKE